MAIPWQNWKKLTAMPVLVTTLVVTGFVAGVRQLGWLQQSELNLYDLFLRSRPALDPDPRLLTVLVTEQDIQKQQTWPLSDQTIADLLRRLNEANPRAIGLDIYRDLPTEPGHSDLANLFAANPQIVPVCKAAGETTDQPEVPPPPIIPTDQVPERVGFADIPIDTDGVIRRNLFLISNSNATRCTTPFSLGFILALMYLDQEPNVNIDISDDRIVLGSSYFSALNPNSGGYVGLDSRGMQILLNYRGNTPQLSQTVTLSDVLEGDVSADLIRDRVVLIGVSAPSIKDIFLTPYSGSEAIAQQMPGVVVHGQMVSQFLSAAMDGRGPIWYWSLPLVVLWIGLWAALGSSLAWWIRQPIYLAASIGGAIALLVGGSWGIFVGMAGWLPVIPPAISLILGGGSIVAYVGYEAQKEQKSFREKVEEQEKALAVLRSLMADNTAALNQALQEPTEITGKPRSLLSGRYKIQKVLGAGGFGRTYLAKDMQRPGQPICVVKHLRPGRTDARFMEVARRLFNTEAEILEKLGRHDQIPLLLAYVEENQEFYLVQEFIEGQSFTAEIAQPQPEPLVIDFLRDILGILSFVHHNYVIHRDIKPDNIIRRQTDHKLVLIDFGAVKQIKPQETETTDGSTVVIGTMGYAPAEQLSGQPCLNSDIYAVGMIAIQSLTGVKPRDIPRDAASGELAWQQYTNVSPELAAIINRMVKFNFTDRYESVDLVLNDLRHLPTR